MSGPPSLESSYLYCRRVARARARNFYYSFVLLDRPRRDAMCAVYAFMRHCDDLSDEPSEGGVPASRAALERWREALDAALAGNPGDHPCWPAFADAARRFRIPPRCFHEMVDGVSSDLEHVAMETFDELYRYCYRVASVVGLSVIHILGFESEEALPLAEKCGIAFQLTNILRDVREDCDNGRIYLPAEDLRRFGVAKEDLRRETPTEAFLELMRFEADRARQYFDESRPVIRLVNPSSRPSLWALIEIYSRLLDRIAQSNYDVLRRRIRLSDLEKTSIVVRGLLRGRRLG